MGLQKGRHTLFLIVFLTVFTWIFINLTWTADISRRLREIRNIGDLKTQILRNNYNFGRLGNGNGYHGDRGSHGNYNGVTELIETKKTRELPQCIIIGVRKGGTRALLDFLSIHPGIQSAGREIHFFDRDENYNLGLDWYRSQMPLSTPGQITIEKTPKYFVTREVPERIAKMNASIKLILIVRDPLERTISDYAQLKWNGKGPRGFENAAIDNATGRVNIRFKSITYSLYYVHFRHWLKYFTLKQMLVMNSEDFAKNPSKTLAKIETFLNLEHALTEDLFYFNVTKGFYCLKEQYKSTFLRRSQISGGCLGSSKGIEHPDVSAEVGEKLREFFRPFNRVFFETIGERFHWL
jgi:hypothetical protein